MVNSKPKFKEGEFVYYFDEDHNINGNFIYKYVKNNETNEIKFLVGNQIKNEEDIFHTRYEAEISSKNTNDKESISLI